MSVRDIVQAAAGSSVADASDPYFKNVSLLLSGDGTNGAQNNTFLDSSTNNFTITRNGNATQGSFSPYGSNWGNYFNGSTDYINAAVGTSLQIGATQDFTLEAWVFLGGYGGAIVCMTSKNYFIVDNGSIYINGDVDPQLTFYGTAVPLNTWTHVAFTRATGSVKCFVNGTQYGSTQTETSKTYFTQTTTLGIGHNLSGGNLFNGYLSNLRIVKGTALYTSNFTPSTTPLTAITNTSLLTCQSNRFIDNSANNFALTVSGTPSVQRFSPFAPTSAYSTSVIGGSGYFDGTGDYLSVADNAALTLNADFTIEFWFNQTSSGNFGILQHRNGASWSSGDFQIQTLSNTILFHTPNGSVSTTTFVLNTWNHYALVRSGSTITAYLNGVVSNTWTNSTSYTGNGGLFRIGEFYDGTHYYFPGYLSDVRIIKGTAVYTANFTPPTTPLTAITNTSLLCNMTNGAIYDNAEMNDLETVGNAQISTAVKKYGTGSMYFDGIGDWLLGKSPTTLNFGTGDFTVEAWVNFSPFVSTYPQLLSSNASAAPQFAFTSTTIYYYNGAVTFSGNYTWSTGVWYHVAWTRQNGTFRMFVNGTSVYSGSISDNITSTDFMVGAYAGGASNGIFAGYIDDLRITKGIARYTANFTPPAQALPTNG